MGGGGGGGGGRGGKNKNSLIWRGRDGGITELMALRTSCLEKRIVVKYNLERDQNCLQIGGEWFVVLFKIKYYECNCNY